MKSDILPESPEVQQVIQMAERYPERARRGAQDPGRDARADRDLPARLDDADSAGAVRGVPGGREDDPHPRALPLDRPSRRRRGVRLRVQRRPLQPGHVPRLPRPVRGRHARERRADVPRAEGGRHPDDPRRRVQAAHQPVRFPGPRQDLPAVSVRARRQVRHQGDRHGDHPRVADRRDPRRAARRRQRRPA